MNFISERLRSIEEQGLTRGLKQHQASIDFSSNDYLGIARSIEFKQQFSERLAHSTLQGATGSRLLTGNSKSIEELEERIAAFHGSEAALLFPTGYMANFGLLQALAQSGDTIIRDEHCHASTIDPIRSTLATSLKFRHNDLENLERKLTATHGETFVAVEALYSMQGDSPDLSDMLEICQRFGAHLLLDEAHSVGIIGKNGKGMANELGVENDLLARVATYGKAFGYQGGVVLCSQELKRYLVNTCRPFIFSTGMNMHQVLGIATAYDLVEKADAEREALKTLVQYFIEKRQTATGNWLDSNTHIQGLVIGNNEEVLALAEKCAAADLLVLPIRRPSVPKNGEMLRITLHSYNNRAHVDLFFNTLGK